MRRLTGLESVFLSAETDTNLFHVGAVAVFDPSTAPAGSPPPYQALCDVLAARLPLLAPFRRRLLTVPGGLDHSRWIEGGEVDLAQHVLRTTLPSPSGPRELADFAAGVMSRRLDRDRPLWEIHVVEGLEGGLVAAVAKIHHAAIDGLTGVELTANLMDLSPEVRPVPPAEPPRDDHLPSPVALAIDGARRLVLRIPRAVTAAGMVTLGMRHLQLHNRHPEEHKPPGLMDAPSSLLGGRIGAARAVGMATVDRVLVDKVRAATGSTVNDVILAVTSAALRAELETSGDLPDKPLVAFVPMAVKGRGKEHDDAVNRLSGMLVSLPTTTPDPVERLVEVKANAGQAKQRERQLGSALFGSVAEILVPFLAGAVTRAASLVGPAVGWPPFNVVVSSFPGSPMPLYCAGSRLVAYHPLGPVVDGSSLNVTAMTYGETLQFGLLACGDTATKVERIAARLPEALAELAEQAA